ncbi:MAG TPA: hypothetical protein VLA74_06730 [Nitrososphaeraceae archaeon]|nr:hypothetical protein [Nitrososphaeraceae archaeon]
MSAVNSIITFGAIAVIGYTLYNKFFPGLGIDQILQGIGSKIPQPGGFPAGPAPVGNVPTFNLIIVRLKPVVVLPQRTDGKIWVGTLSWSASKPVEVRLLQNYDADVKPDAAHGKPVTAQFAQGESAISLILQSNGAGTVPSYNAGSMNFAASQVAFHTLGGIPFTVTYTVDAEAKSLSS